MYDTRVSSCAFSLPSTCLAHLIVAMPKARSTAIEERVSEEQRASWEAWDAWYAAGRPAGWAVTVAPPDMDAAALRLHRMRTYSDQQWWDLLAQEAVELMGADASAAAARASTEPPTTANVAGPVEAHIATDAASTGSIASPEVELTDEENGIRRAMGDWVATRCPDGTPVSRSGPLADIQTVSRPFPVFPKRAIVTVIRAYDGGETEHPPIAGKAAPTVSPPSRDTPLLHELAAKVREGMPFTMEDWAAVELCLMQHSIPLPEDGPSDGMHVPWSDTAWWHDKCY